MKYFISCGEVSGEMHASYIAAELMKKSPNIEIYASGGEKLRNIGAHIVEDIENIAVMGITEVIGKIYYLKKKADEYITLMLEKGIKNIIFVDYGGFNLYLLKRIKKEVPEAVTFYYIPPKLWAWGKGRIKKLRLADHIMVIFPWEKDFYAKNGVNAVYFGNPLVDVIKRVDTSGEKILLLPGSRQNEIETLMPVFIQCAQANSSKQFVVKAATLNQRKRIFELINGIENITILDEKLTLAEAAAQCRAAIAASGTVTLELALMGLPTVVCYRFSVITEMIAKLFLKIKYISLPNLIMEREVFKELLQKNLNTKNLCVELEKAIESKNQHYFSEIRERLGGEQIIEKYSIYILKESKSD